MSSTSGSSDTESCSDCLDGGAGAEMAVFGGMLMGYMVGEIVGRAR